METATKLTVKQLPVPSESVPALIGLGGQNVRSTMAVTNTTITFIKSPHISRAVITGDSSNVALAQQVRKLAVLHHQAAVRPLSVRDNLGQPGLAEAALDLRTFKFEIDNLRAHCNDRF